MHHDDDAHSDNSVLHASVSEQLKMCIRDRGREVREFIERDLGPEGMARSVVVVATSEMCIRDRHRVHQRLPQ